MLVILLTHLATGPRSAVTLVAASVPEWLIRLVQTAS